MVSARMDDVANYLPARLSWLLLGIAAGLCRLRVGGRCVLAGVTVITSSPNCTVGSVCGWRFLGIQLGGPNNYSSLASVWTSPRIGDAQRDISVTIFPERFD